MGKFNFKEESIKTTISIRVTEVIAGEMLRIAKKEGVKIQDIAREFVRVGLEEYKQEKDATSRGAKTS